MKRVSAEALVQSREHENWINRHGLPINRNSKEAFFRCLWSVHNSVDKQIQFCKKPHNEAVVQIVQESLLEKTTMSERALTTQHFSA